jgi:hypothetical protein
MASSLFGNNQNSQMMAQRKNPMQMMQDFTNFVNKYKNMPAQQVVEDMKKTGQLSQEKYNFIMNGGMNSPQMKTLMNQANQLVNSISAFRR